MIVVHGMPPLWGAPSPSPFVIKLEMWLRMVDLPYEARPITGPPRSRTGKIPYVDLPDGRQLHDSGLIIAILAREHDRDLDVGLSAQDRAVGHAVRRMVEEHLYFVGAYDRWLDETGYAATAAGYFQHLPRPLRWIVPWVLRRKMRAALHGQGTARHDPETRRALAAADLDAIVAILGDREHLLGPLTTVDATLAGFLWAWTCNPFPSTLGELVSERPTLGAYLDRIRERYWMVSHPRVAATRCSP